MTKVNKYDPRIGRKNNIMRSKIAMHNPATRKSDYIDKSLAMHFKRFDEPKAALI